VASEFASGKFSIAQCDRCGFRFKLTDLKKEIIKTKKYDLKVCSQCWDPDQPQLQLGMYPVSDPIAVREPRPDTTYYSAGLTGLQLTDEGGSSVYGSGTPTVGSRQIQWGWNPVGMKYDFNETPNTLDAAGAVGTVTIIGG
jgi:hypothetical protein